MTVARSSGGPPIGVVVSDALLGVLTTAWAEHGIEARAVSPYLGRVDGASLGSHGLRVALIVVGEDLVEAMTTLFSLRHNLGAGIAVVAVVQNAALEPRLLRAGFVHCLRAPYTADDVFVAIKAAANTPWTDEGFAHRTGMLREGRFVFRSPEEARTLAHTLSRLCPDPMRQHVGIEELLLNAVEHGNLGIDGSEKARLLRAGADWSAELAGRLAQPVHAGKRVQVFWRDQDGEISLSVVDEGQGFEHERWLSPQPDRASAPNGRGIALARALSFDSLHYEGCGNHAVARIRQSHAAAEQSVSPSKRNQTDSTTASPNWNLSHQLDELLRVNLAAKNDQDMALRVVGNILSNSHLDHPAVRYILTPLERFSGDVLLVHPLPEGGLRVFLGDFAGHGLAAAIGTIPLASIFFATVRKGVSLEESIATINQRLFEIMPSSMFCAATILEVNADWNEATFLTAGMPPVLLNHADSGRIEQWTTPHLPLGVLDSHQLTFPLQRVSIKRGDRVYLYSDGVTEQRNNRDDLFGQTRLEQVISSLGPGADVAQKLREEIAAFKEGQATNDDLTFFELTIMPPASLAG